MPLATHQLHDILKRHTECLEQLRAAYQEMDARYDAAARSYGFECRGCDDNCCLTRFYHHTLIEILGLFAGYLTLPEKQRRMVYQRAVAYDRAMQMGQTRHETRRQICPLNIDTRCLLYRERPMICRLHGIPHAMRHPMKGLITGTGCHFFEASYRQNNGHPLDRTPIYTGMAQIEKKLRLNSGIDIPVRLTVAQMILCFNGRFDPDGTAADSKDHAKGRRKSL